MGTVRSIIDVDVNSDSFKEFQKRFDAYQKALQTMPAQWSKVTAAATAAGQATAQASQGAIQNSQQLAHAMASMTAALASVVRQQGNAAVVGSNTSRVFQGISRTTGQILKNVASTTFQLAKWGALGGVVGLATGIWGIDKIASAGSDIRRTSGSYGVSPGQLRAARAIYGPQLDADSLLSNIAAAKADPSKRYSFAAIGVNPDSGNPGDLLPQVIQGIAERFRQTGGNAAAFNAMGMNNLMDMNTAREMAGLSPKELAGEASQYGAESRRLGIDDQTLEKMKALNQAFSVAKDRIETVLINGLSKLSEPLGHLSDSIVKALETFANNPNIGKAVESFGKGIEHVAEYLNSPSFKQDINDFAQLIHNFSHPGEYIKNKFANEDSFGTAGSNLLAAAKQGLGIDAATRGIHSYLIANTEKQYGLPKGMLDSIWANESSRGANATTNPVTKAFGDFQFIPKTAAEYGITPDSNFAQQEDAAGRKLRNLLAYYHGDTRKAVAAYFDGEGNLDKVIATAAQNHTDWTGGLGPKTASYLGKAGPAAGASTGVTVTVNNQTGGDSIVTASQLAH